MLGKWAVYAVVLLLLLAVLLVWRSPGEAPVGYELGTPAELASIARIERALDKQTTLQFHEVPLDQAVRQIAAQSGIEILIDHKALEDISVPVETPVSLDASGIRLRRALDRLLRPLDLAWVLENEALRVTSVEKAAKALTVFVYPVHDLARPGWSRNGKNYQGLIDLIESTIVSESWSNNGGIGWIGEHSASGTLVVSQTRPIHEWITDLLAALRTARDTQQAGPDPPNHQVTPSGQIRSTNPTGPPQPAPTKEPPSGGGSESARGGQRRGAARADIGHRSAKLPTLRFECRAAIP